ncbi:MAG: rhodanese-like domain-containing protein [Candidatus Aminicenantes bacterium]
MKKTFCLWLSVLAVVCCAFSQEIEDISSKEAYELLKEPDTYLVDVRSIAEYVFVGHPAMAHNIPLMFWDERKQDFVPNESFLENVKSRFETKGRLIFICRSGGRSKRAALKARGAGFSRVLNIALGFEGEEDPDGYRVVNGWKNSLPYTYEFDRKLIYRN